jgi:DNA repair protein SbcC/Rad50
MNIRLKQIHMENFKIFQNQTIEFSDITKIFSQNYMGKSSIVDAFNWVLFGKSGTGNSEGKQFHPRRYDENGIDIDHVDIIVELFLSVDGKELVIKKIQSQKWPRKRGSEERTYEGDTNEYVWNEVPVNETEHKKRVAEIIQEDVFRKITNPHAFTGMDQKDQRKFLLEKIANITDADVFAIDEKFAELQKQTEHYTIEELRAINKKALSTHKKEQEEIPVRIDEVSKTIVDIEYSKHESSLLALKEQLAIVENQISDTSKGYEEVNKVKAEIASIKGKMDAIERSEQEKLNSKIWETNQKIKNCDNEFYSLHQRQTQIEKDIELKKSLIVKNTEYLEKLGNDYTAEKARVMNENSNICPVCNQEYPDSMRAKMIEAFNSDKEANLMKINVAGKDVADGIKKCNAEIAELEKQIEQIKADKVCVNGEKNKLTEKLTILPVKVTIVDLENMSEYRQLYDDWVIKQKELSLMDTSTVETLKKSLFEKKQSIQSEIEAVQKILNGKKVIADAKVRVDQLKEELKETTQKVANCERMEFLFERFEKAKMDLLSERINKKFKLVQWKLWHQQKNGGFEPVCVCMVHGSAYGENTTSTTERLMAGLDIISTLQDIYNTKAPIFIDNKESYNDWNIPQMDCQMVLLSVSGDKELKVEVNG